MSDTKHCTSCDRDLPRSKFHYSLVSWGNKNGTCKACTATQKAQYRENRDKKRELVKFI